MHRDAGECRLSSHHAHFSGARPSSAGLSKHERMMTKKGHSWDSMATYNREHTRRIDNMFKKGQCAEDKATVAMEAEEGAKLAEYDGNKEPDSHTEEAEEFDDSVDDSNLDEVAQEGDAVRPAANESACKKTRTE